MTKNFHKEIKLAMKAGMYQDLSTKEKAIYKSGFRNGYILARDHNKKNKKQYTPKRIVGYSFGKPTKSVIESIINKVCVRYEVSKKELMITRSRRQDICRTKNIIFNLLSEKFNMNLSTIGKIFGNDHTTVLHSIKMKNNKERFWSPEQTLWKEFDELKATIT
jgi:chromosomal replication initiation ATPase DnaA|tara:strand:+ start:476 stop:964 length:489 start_codon:yes stop_codon:yes gene_type:complete